MARYKFSLSPHVRRMAEWDLEHYYENKKSLEQYKADILPSFTQRYSRDTGKTKTQGVNPSFIKTGEISKPTEDSGIKLATSQYILHVEQCIKAVEKALEHCDDTDIKLIDLVYWKQTYTISGAAQKVSLTKSPAYTRINGILCFIALELGYVNI